MFEVWHLAAAYVVGSAAALWLFRMWVQEKIVTATLDTLIEQGYLYSWLDEDGTTQITKWQDLLQTDLERIESMDPDEIDAILDELLEEDKRRKNEEDDTP